MGIPMGFYNIPIVVIFLVALLVACFQNRQLPFFDDKLVVMGRGIGDKHHRHHDPYLHGGRRVRWAPWDVIPPSRWPTCMLSVIPAEYAVAVLFVVSCFVSLSMGTSVGTITLITPIAVAVAAASGFSLPLCVASVMGGAMFGDNLSFISDTTIRRLPGPQGCQMKDKFRENFKIALPAALVTLVIILAAVAGHRHLRHGRKTITTCWSSSRTSSFLWAALWASTCSSCFCSAFCPALSLWWPRAPLAATDLLGNMGTRRRRHVRRRLWWRCSCSAICALIRENGGFVALLNGIKRLFTQPEGRPARHGACSWAPWTSPPLTTPWPS
ncbi:MAG: Na+/H+ antiporter NhaC family protein [Adlercreutzia equolifaciens]